MSKSVSKGQIVDKAVELKKIQDISTNRLLGRTTAGTGVVEQLTSLNDTVHGTLGGGTLHAAATTSTAGFLSSSDKTRIERMKAGTVVAASFAGTPKTAAVTFGTAYPDTNYAITLVCLVTTTGSAYTPQISAKSTTGFTITMTVNNIGNLTSVDWMTEYHSNT